MPFGSTTFFSECDKVLRINALHAPQRLAARGPRVPTARSTLPIVLLAILVVSVGADVFRLGWFADDFKFLDVARRIPLWHSLNGQHGIFPWYRPLSREFYYELIVAAGPAGLAFAHLVQVASLFGCAWALMRFAARLLEPRLVPIAPALFVTYEFTKFVAGWSAGFQDLLAQFLVLAALADFAEGRRRRSLVWAALAPLAKETGFIVLPLLVVYEWMFRRERGWREWLPGHLVVWLALAAFHVLVRLTWRTGGAGTPIEQTRASFLRALVDVPAGFVGRTPVMEPWAAGAAITAGVSALLLMLTFERALRPSRSGTEVATPGAGRPASGRTLAFLVIAAAAGLAPMVTGLFARLTFVHAYHAFPAVPWLALIAAFGLGRLPSFLPRLVVPVLVAWNAWCLGFAAPNLDAPPAWGLGRRDWKEAVRLSAISRRFSEDVRQALAARPDSLVLLYWAVPTGCLVQTEDGPATREVLGDPTVRAFFMHGLPFRVERDRLAVVTFDLDRLHFASLKPTFGNALEISSYAVMGGSGWPAYALAASSPDTTAGPGFALQYLRAAARLLEEGPNAFVRALAEAGVTDTLGDTPDSVGYAMIPKTTPIGVALVGVLRHPLSAAAHSNYAQRLAERDFLVTAGVEYRLAVALDPGRVDDRMSLAMVLWSVSDDDAAIAELNRAARDAPGTETAAKARATIEWLEATAADAVARSNQ